MTVRIDDGFSTTVSIYDDKDDVTPEVVKFWEKSVTPPGVQGGGANDTSTMRNTAWRTMAPKKLRTLSEASLNVAYDPELYETILSLLQVVKWIEIDWPDGSHLGFWGWIDSFEPNEVVEGEQPTADITVIPSNQTPAGTEEAPVYSGT
jgi:hypothetical protein